MKSRSSSWTSYSGESDGIIPSISSTSRSLEISRTASEEEDCFEEEEETAAGLEAAAERRRVQSDSLFVKEIKAQARQGIQWTSDQWSRYRALTVKVIMTLCEEHRRVTRLITRATAEGSKEGPLLNQAWTELKLVCHDE